MMIKARNVFRRCPPTAAALVSAVFLSCGAGDVAGEVVNLNLDAPTLDRWNYPFASNPGGNPYAAVFAALASTGFDPLFDNRDGQMIVGYNTAGAGVSPGLALNQYHVLSAVVTITVESDETFLYDPTPDSYRTWLPATDPDFLIDADPGHAVELFGTGFRNGFNALTYTESAAYSPSGPFGKRVRSAFPVSFASNGGPCIDVSNNVDERFDPSPFAVGLNAALTPGQPVPLDTVFTFTLNVTNADVQRYLRRALRQGMLQLTVASIFPAEQQKTGTYPRLYTKENLAVLAQIVDAASLELSVDVLPAPAHDAGDVNLDGAVNVNDLLAVIGAWGPCTCCAADVNADDVVNVNDLLTVIGDWD